LSFSSGATVPLALSISLAFTRDRAGRSTVPVIDKASGTVAPEEKDKVVEEAKACRAPLASMRLSRTTAKITISPLPAS
jgi:hypothetical protein